MYTIKRISLHVLSAFLVSLIVLSACKKEEPIVYGSVDGQILNGFSQQPEEDVLLYLFDKSIAIDSVNYSHDSPVIDSTRTDASGFYEIDSIPPGLYAIMPVDTFLQVTHVESTDQYEFEMLEGEDYSVDFMIAPIVMSGQTFTTELEVINTPFRGDYLWVTLYYERRNWWLWEPWFASREVLFLTYATYDPTYWGSFESSWGYFDLFHTIDNFFKCKLWVTNAENEDAYYYFDLYTPFHDTPDPVKWVFDCEADSLYRVN